MKPKAAAPPTESGYYWVKISVGTPTNTNKRIIYNHKNVDINKLDWIFTRIMVPSKEEIEDEGAQVRLYFIGTEFCEYWDDFGKVVVAVSDKVTIKNPDGIEYEPDWSI